MNFLFNSPTPLTAGVLATDALTTADTPILGFGTAYVIDRGTSNNDTLPVSTRRVWTRRGVVSSGRWPVSRSKHNSVKPCCRNGFQLRSVYKIGITHYLCEDPSRRCHRTLRVKRLAKPMWIELRTRLRRRRRKSACFRLNEMWIWEMLPFLISYNYRFISKSGKDGLRWFRTVYPASCLSRRFR
jgi:hypothetical protein